jgi:predicted RNA-binding Zn ribbon-like protein
LAVVQAFMNTRWDLASAGHTEMLASPDALQGWLLTQGLVRGPIRVTDDDLDRALVIREALRALAFANNGHDVDQAAVATLRAASSEAKVEIYLELDGPRFVADTKSIEGAIAALFAITARAMIDGSWQRLKACPGRHCGWAFYDHSRNQSGRWCSMKVCGERDKARAYYRRKTRQATTLE